MARLSEAQLRESVRRCEHALSKRCNCCCGGALHGQHHDEAWIRAQLEVMSIDTRYTHGANADTNPAQLELFTR